ncbi:MAG: hypothetical protein M1834_007424 [Cirrosporium novae-zelandiae]|nr:MAG: hypothetical protein M1834_007424 [Cirrosporium novae-zelandiae]
MATQTSGLAKSMALECVQSMYAEIHETATSINQVGIFSANQAQGANSIQERLNNVLEALESTFAAYGVLSSGQNWTGPQPAKRLAVFAKMLSWMLLSICLHSHAFLMAVMTYPDHVWRVLCLAITPNKLSLELFAKSRDLPWQAPLEVLHAAHKGLTSLASNMKSTLTINRIDHPHQWALTLSGTASRLPYTNITSNIYHHSFFPRARPPYWPFLTYPIDPMTRRSADRNCKICNSPYICPCNPSSLPQLHIELREYSGKGIGVRSLQAIPAGTILGEYVGEIRHPHMCRGTIYSLEVPVADDTDNRWVAAVDATRFGNWTRFMNHSCNPGAVFQLFSYGEKRRMLAITVRSIGVFEEITCDYGDLYWHKDRLCRCGEPGCQFDTVEKIEARMPSRRG